jgi:hypothetical protein
MFNATRWSFVGNGTQPSAVLEAVGAGTGWAGLQQLGRLAWDEGRVGQPCLEQQQDACMALEQKANAGPGSSPAKSAPKITILITLVVTGLAPSLHVAYDRSTALASRPARRRAPGRSTWCVLARKPGGT